MNLESQSDTSEKAHSYQCEHCGGHFMVTGEMLDNDLMCPHCQKEVSPVKKTSEEMEPIEEVKTSEPPHLPAPKKQKFVATKRTEIKNIAEDAKGKKFYDKVQEFVPVPEHKPLSKKRAKAFEQKDEKSAILSFFLILGALSMLTIGGLFIYKTMNLPDVEAYVNAEGNVLVDQEYKNSIPLQSQFEMEEEDVFNPPTNASQSDDPILNMAMEGLFRKGDLDNVLKLLQNFHSAKTVETRLKYVFAPDNTREAMTIQEERDKENPPASPSPPKQLLDARISNNMLFAQVVSEDGSMRQTIFVRENDKSPWLLEWFSWAQYQDMTYDELITKRPKTPVKVRVDFGMGASYAAPFESNFSAQNYEGKSYINIDLIFGSNKTLRGYADRTADLSHAMTKELMSGYAQGIVTIRFPEDSANASPDQVIIESYIRPTWLGDKAYEIFQQGEKTNASSFQ